MSPLNELCCNHSIDSEEFPGEKISKYVRFLLYFFFKIFIEFLDDNSQTSLNNLIPLKK